MKNWEWNLLVTIATLLLITTFFIRNLYIAVGLFALSMHLKKYSRNISLPKQFNSSSKSLQRKH